MLVLFQASKGDMYMMTNVGVVEAALRLFVGLILLLPHDSRSDGLLLGSAIWLGWAAGTALVLTATLRYSPIYAAFKLTSCAPYPGPNEH
jgi:hypothetical protein